MSTERLRVAVVGAGIAGLTVAAALARQSVRCQVLEQASRLAEVGAGVQVAPNATRLLHRLGLRDRLECVAVRPQAVEMRRWDTGTVLARMTHGDDCQRLFGAPYYTFHRADLHDALRALVPADQILLGRKCVAVTERDGEVELRFADRSAVTADVVIGADGIHSVVRDLLVRDQPRFSGQTIYRALVPAERVPQLRAAPKVVLWLGPSQHCVAYPVAGGRLVNFAATTPAGRWRMESWAAQGRVEDLLAAYDGWHPELTALLASADRVSRWALYDRDTVPRWCTDRVAITGDAAHPMLPFMAQGANQAIEDAVVLARCLQEATPATVPQALRTYEELRKPRTATVHRRSRENARVFHHADGDAQQSRDREFGATLDLRSQEWLYGFDAELAVTG